MKMYRFNRKVKLFCGIIFGGSLFLTAALAVAQEDVTTHPNCPFCGMDRAKFAHSRFYIEYDDGSAVGLCSLHCAAVDMALKIDKTPRAIKVGDYSSKRLIDAETAHWVIGGEKMGVMTKQAKWAFENKKDAGDFIAAHGGKPATFDEAIRAAFEDMYEDLKMIRNKRKMMKMKKEKG